MANKIRHKNFINTYENKIKELRKEYYKNMTLSKNSFSIDLSLIAMILSVIILILFGFNINSFIISFIAMIILNIVFRVLSKALNLDKQNSYVKEIRKLGYFSVDAYENSLKKYVTGPGGYYEVYLNKLKKRYNLTDNVRKIEGEAGELYYIWMNSDQNSFNLLNERTVDKPEVISIEYDSVRYFRVDNNSNSIILKTSMNIYKFKMSAFDILNEILKNKRLDNIHTFNPEMYISDFEIFIHNYESNINNKKRKKNYNDFDKELSKFIVFIILYVVCSGLCYVYDMSLFKIGVLVLMICLNYAFVSLLNSKKVRVNNEMDLIKLMNNDKECIDMFNELKVALCIFDNYDIVYSKDNAPYYTWVANGYFHVFLNVIYTNVIYMSVKITDVNYYRCSNNSCTVKLKDRMLEFRKDSKNVFDKILPNKDYDWLKGFQQK